MADKTARKWPTNSEKMTDKNSEKMADKKETKTERRPPTNTANINATSRMTRANNEKKVWSDDNENESD